MVSPSLRSIFPLTMPKSGRILSYLPVTGVILVGFCLFAWAEAPAMKNIAAGNDIIPFSVPDRTGTIFNSASLAGKPAAVIFWSTWSPRSAEILEDFKRYHQELGPKGLIIVAINVEGENLSFEKKKAIRDFLDRLQLPYTVLLDEDLKAFADYGVVAHPSSLVVDAGGKVTYVLGGYPLSLREELKDNLLKVLGLYVPPPKEPPPSVGYLPQGGALQFFNLGRQLMDRGQTDKAMDYFEKAIERDPAFMEPVIMTARLLLLQQDVDKAQERLKQVSVDTFNRNDVRFLFGYLMLLKEKTADAETLFKIIRDASPNEGWGWWGLGLAALARGDLPAALASLEKGRSLQPANIEAETYLQRYGKQRWIRSETFPEEERFVNLFPSLAETRERYRKLYSVPAGATSP